VGQDLEMIIKNKEELISHGNVEGRKAVLEILEAGMVAADPYENVKRLIRVEDGKLIVGTDDIPPWPSPRRASVSKLMRREPLVFDLTEVGQIYVVGGGKAAQRQAKAMEDVLGDLIAEGHVNAKKGDEVYLERIGVTLAGHPIPDEDSVEGAKKILKIEKKAKGGDIVFHSESGGGSALLTLPAPGITLEDLREVNRILYFECGAPMPDVNAVRNQLTILRLRHARHVGDATLIRISTDERPPGLRVHMHRRPGGVESYQYAINLLRSYGCWERVPQSVRTFLLKADPDYAPLRPEEWDEKPRHYFRVMGPECMLEAAVHKAEELGLNATILVSSLSDIEAQPAGQMASFIAQEIEVYGRPMKPPCAFLCGGELVVTVGEEQGIGGRNQEFVLSAAPRIEGSRRIVVASADSDGCDGPTDVAGGIVDGYTMDRARQAGIDVFEELRRHNSSAALRELSDTVFMGVQNTNVQDLRVVYVGAA
jgi:glycerate 2-kinase